MSGEKEEDKYLDADGYIEGHIFDSLTLEKAKSINFLIQGFEQEIVHVIDMKGNAFFMLAWDYEDDVMPSLCTLLDEVEKIKVKIKASKVEYVKFYFFSSG